MRRRSEQSAMFHPPFDLCAPVVDRTLCIGCGICEYKCPVNGEAAIRVYAPGRDSV